MQESYDVVIMGGGPAGSTLAALLRRRKGNFRVLVVDSETFPREHVGESLVHAGMPFFEEAGSLAKVIDSACWIKKYGGVFFWDKEGPSVTYFDHPEYLQDGVRRWALHVNRAEFDKILLDNARDQGAEVREGVAAHSYEPGHDGGVVTLADGRSVRARMFVDASGRNNRVISKQRPAFLSQYKNIAIWNHYRNCRFAQTLEGDWNIFAKDDLSPIACAAFEDGWIWYIPVRMPVDGERLTVHSIGVITDPTLLNQPGKDYAQPDVFLDKLRAIPALRDLVKDAVPVHDTMRIAANYSMMRDRFCNPDERWLMIGDAAYFVDPLFSSGVTFASGQASCAELLIRSTLNGDLPQDELRLLWDDYESEWRGVAQAFALSIDQWYHAIAANHADSVYWKVRQNTAAADLGIRRSSFQFLVDAAVTPDLLQVLTRGSLDPRDLDAAGPFMQALAELDRAEPVDGDRVRLRPGVELQTSHTITIPGFKASLLPLDASDEERRQAARYWASLEEGPIAMPSPHEDLAPCLRFVDRRRNIQLRCAGDPEGVTKLCALLSEGGQRYGDIRPGLDDQQRALVKKLVVNGLLEVTIAASAA